MAGGVFSWYSVTMGIREFQVVRLTPPGRGAVATLLVEGPGAIETVASHFHTPCGRPLSDYPADRLVFGHFGFGHFGSATGEEVVARRRSEHSVELHCHGGHAAAAMIEWALVEQGCRTATWQDWTARHHSDPITAAACIALAEARTRRTAAILLDQYHGALRRAWQAVEETTGQGDTAAAAGQIESLLARAELGQHLVRPWQVVLAGRTNVGKSSLINALVGYRRAIVHHVPGTTRDVVTARAAVDGWPIELSDTAGLRASDDATERAGVALAEEKLATADLVLLVFDASQPWSESDGALIEDWPTALVVHNKRDLPPSADGRPPGLFTSAPAGEGIESLVGAIADRLVPDPPAPGAAVPFTADQIEHLARLSEDLGSAARSSC